MMTYEPRFLRLGAGRAAFVPLLVLMAASAVRAQVLVPQVTTNKGCRETGDDPTFAIGERIAVSFRVGSASLSQAAASILDDTTSGQVIVFGLGQVSTNQTYTFTASVGGPAGTETLVLRARTPGATADSGPCSFTVGGAVSTVTPRATRTPSQTRTPTRTRTPQSATATPGNDLTGELHTSRGCREDGDEATFAVGERITLSLRLDSDVASSALASIVSSRPNGPDTVTSFGRVPTNVPLLVAGRVGPPSGVHTLRLRGSLGGPQATLDTCSFLVSGDVPPTVTPKSTRTMTPSRTRTPTRTFTPVPGVCLGACTQPNTVTVTDILTVVKIATGEASLSACSVADGNGDQQVSLEEILQAVNNALDGCP